MLKKVRQHYREGAAEVQAEIKHLESSLNLDLGLSRMLRSCWIAVGDILRDLLLLPHTCKPFKSCC